MLIPPKKAFNRSMVNIFEKNDENKILQLVGEYNVIVVSKKVKFLLSRFYLSKSLFAL